LPNAGEPVSPLWPDLVPQVSPFERVWEQQQEQQRQQEQQQQQQLVSWHWG